MKMTSMKCDEGSDCSTPVADNPYGYGLLIRLNDDQCEAMGITTPMTAGSKVSVNALAFVVSATQSVEDDGDDAGPDICLELQITDMEINAASSSKPEDVLYGATS